MANNFEGVPLNLRNDLAGNQALPELILAEQFKGITTDGTVVPNLYPIATTGVSTQPMLDAATKLLAGLNLHQRRKTMFPVDSDEWYWWNNTSSNNYRSGISFMELSQPQKDLAFGLLTASLSAHGFETTRNIMKLNETIRELTGHTPRYGEYQYWLSIFGEPSSDRPWGWQLDGHHANLNYFVLGDQVVFSPVFVGSEPVVAVSGVYAGTSVLQLEQQRALDVMNCLTPEQQAKATIGTGLPRDVLTSAWQDNLQLDYAGIRFNELSSEQQAVLMHFVETYAGYMDDGHAAVKMSEIKRHLDETFFAWIGEHKDDSIFYCRVQSPVVIIEFDHVPQIAFMGELRGLLPSVPSERNYAYYRLPAAAPNIGETPYHDHIHSTVRTPNGNDYGRDLLRQHYAQYDHSNLTSATSH